jgi:hypothetical protein
MGFSNFIIVGKDLAVKPFYLIILLPCCEEFITEAFKGVCYIVVVLALAIYIQYPVFKLSLAFRLAEDKVHLTDDEFEHVDSPVQHIQDVVLCRVGGAQIVHVYRAGLTDAVDAADALFDLHGIPGQIKVDHGRTKLEVSSLSSDLGAKHDIVPVLKIAHGTVLFCRTHIALELGETDPGLGKSLRDLFQRCREA